MQNKPLSGTVFGLVGLVGLVLLIAASTWFIRRSRKNRLERAAEAFDDALPGGAGGGYTDDKLTRSGSGRSSGSGAGSADGLVSQRNRFSDGTSNQVPAQSTAGYGQYAAYGAYNNTGYGAAYQQPAAYQNPAYMSQQQQPIPRAPSAAPIQNAGWGGAAPMQATTYGQPANMQQAPAAVPQTRESTGSDAYGNYAFATGPGQQGSGPRNLTVANA